MITIATIAMMIHIGAEMLAASTLPSSSVDGPGVPGEDAR